MRNPVFASAALVMAAVGVVVGAEVVKSGLQVGEHAPAYNVRDITGPNQGKTLCYR